jgi:glycosyltransferase involved in cell wall biosynthesis
VAICDDGLAEHERLDEKREVWRVRLRLPNRNPALVFKVVRYIEWQARIFLRFRSSPAKLINCHSLSVLPIGSLFKLFSKAILVYDTHELETEVAGAVGIRRPLGKLVEKALIRFVDVVITVNDSIAQWYRDTYGLNNVYAVRNIPYQRDEREIGPDSILKRKFGIGDDEILFLHQGGLPTGRGIGIILETFTKVDPRKHIVFLGHGQWVETIREYEQKYPNIHFHNAVSPQEVHKYTRGADVGISLTENTCLNHYLSLPNKIFEYIMSGLPVIVSDFPEMRRIVEESGCGWKIAADRNELFSLIKTISWADIIDKRNKARQFRQTLDWGQEEKILLRIYRNVIYQGVSTYSR